ncbi:hypothetical protein [Pontixanthobacter luteolus]|uniref:hypothetical protein n=1 Tax=Pontixanthobacter luteolus TaxID=295089 RepID=UPI0023021EA8|nr:hypothetical protein [Pontixanthobacter luteolus]
MKTPTKKITLALSAAALALVGGTAIAAQQNDRRGADANGDKIVTLAEHNAHADTMFARLDADGNGIINAEDRAARKEARFARLDADGNGEVTKAEMDAAASERRAKRADRADARFARLDTDNSGGISAAEMEAAREMRSERRGKRGDRMEARGKRGGDKMARGNRGKRGKQGMAMLRQADTNGDKAISRAEFDAAMTARFQKMDTDNSGSISQEERQAARAERKAARQAR